MKKYITLLLLITVSTFLSAQNFNDALLLSEPGIFNGARSLGMGNSYVAISDDYSSIFFNPAGLGLINKLGLTASINSNNFDNSTTFLRNSISSSKNDIKLSQFGFVFPVPTVRGSLVFSLGYNQVKNFNSVVEFDGFNNGNTSMIQHLTGDINDVAPLTYDIGLAYEVRDPITDEYIRDETLINGMLNQSGIIKTEGSIGAWSFAGSAEVSKGLFVGGTFNILSGNYKRDRDYYEDDTRDIYGDDLELFPGDADTRDFLTFYLNDIIDWDLTGWNFKLGMLYAWEQLFKFGVAVKFPTYYTIKENYYVDVSSEFRTSTIFELIDPIIDEIEYEIRTPFEISAGASGSIDYVTLSASGKVIDYTQMEFTEGFDGEFHIEQNKEIDDLFRTSYTLNLGAEIKVPMLPFALRVGGMYIQSPYEDDPAEFDKKFLTAGVGFSFQNSFRIDIAYAYGWWENFSDNYGSGVSRVMHDVTVHNIILGVSAGLN
ncbi:MAG: outer membrane protein transport protein [Ignavibacteria bacterium]|jgi:long-subunit fatty acid transport protein